MFRYFTSYERAFTWLRDEILVIQVKDRDSAKTYKNVRHQPLHIFKPNSNKCMMKSQHFSFHVCSLNSISLIVSWINEDLHKWQTLQGSWLQPNVHTCFRHSASNFCNKAIGCDLPVCLGFFSSILKSVEGPSPPVCVWKREGGSGSDYPQWIISSALKLVQIMRRNQVGGANWSIKYV